MKIHFTIQTVSWKPYQVKQRIHVFVRVNFPTNARDSPIILGDIVIAKTIKTRENRKLRLIKRLTAPIIDTKSIKDSLKAVFTK